MRFAVVAALAIHAALIAWLAPRQPEPTAEPRVEAPPVETVVEVVLFDDPESPKVISPKVKAASTIASPHLATVATGEVALAPTPTVANKPIVTSDVRHIDLSPAQIVDHAAASEGAPSAPVAHESELRPSRDGTFTTDLGGSNWRNRTATAHVARDGTVRFENAPDFDIHFAGLGFAGKVNVDDWLARKHGIDPYASAKLAYLDRTRDERAHIAEVNRADDLAHAPRAMQRNVEAALAIANPAARKQALFELWDDVAETGDDALVTAGARARSTLVGAIRAMRPALVFTPDELAQLNAHRHSRELFAPYD